MNCSKEGCEATATLGLRIYMRSHPGGVPDVVCIKFGVCDAHVPDDADMQKTIDENYEYLCLGAEQMGNPKPKRALTMYEFIPWDEIEDFFRDSVAQAHRNVRTQ